MSAERPKVAWRDLDGVLLLDKPAGISSNQALQQARRLLAAAKGGHTGNLDPMATGLLPLCLGEATKFARFLLDSDKRYDAEFELGVTTTTGDREGEILVRRPVDYDTPGLQQALRALTGEIRQVPPMYSALKHQGRKLYELARAGIEVEREARTVTIHSLELKEASGTRIRLSVHCSKGTYVRVLGEALGDLLGCGAHMTGLRRVASGGFGVTDALTLEALGDLSPETRVQKLLPIDVLVAHLPALHLEQDSLRRILHGQAIRLEQSELGQMRLYARDRFVGIGHADAGLLRPLRLLHTGGDLPADQNNR